MRSSLLFTFADEETEATENLSNESPVAIIVWKLAGKSRFFPLILKPLDLIITAPGCHSMTILERDLTFWMRKPRPRDSHTCRKAGIEVTAELRTQVC